MKVNTFATMGVLSLVIFLGHATGIMIKRRMDPYTKPVVPSNPLRSHQTSDTSRGIDKSHTKGEKALRGPGLNRRAALETPFEEWNREHKEAVKKVAEAEELRLSVKGKADRMTMPMTMSQSSTTASRPTPSHMSGTSGLAGKGKMSQAERPIKEMKKRDMNMQSWLDNRKNN